MKIFHWKRSFENYLVWEIFFRPPKLGAKSPHMDMPKQMLLPSTMHILSVMLNYECMLQFLIENKVTIAT